MRIAQPEGARGSLKWLQRAVVHRPDLLQPARLKPIRWVSPLAEDDFAEYRDAAFLSRIGQPDLAPRLSEFWPKRGPQWDALGLTEDGPVLVEAKAHVGEFLSDASMAGGASRALIAASLAAVRDDLGADPDVDWARHFYQFTNRLAHLWWLRRQGVQAQLLLVNFINDDERGGPCATETWTAVYYAAHYVLGLPKRHPLSGVIHHVYPNVHDLTEGV